MLGVNSGEHIMFSTDILNNLTMLDVYSQVHLNLHLGAFFNNSNIQTQTHTTTNTLNQNWEVECPNLVWAIIGNWRSPETAGLNSGWSEKKYKSAGIFKSL